MQPLRVAGIALHFQGIVARPPIEIVRADRNEKPVPRRIVSVSTAKTRVSR
jgi:hypothetical protein